MHLKLIKQNYDLTKLLACAGKEARLIEAYIQIIVSNKVAIPGVMPIAKEFNLTFNPHDDMDETPQGGEIPKWATEMGRLMHEAAAELGACHAQHHNFHDYFYAERNVTFKVL